MNSQVSLAAGEQRGGRLFWLTPALGIIGKKGWEIPILFPKELLIL